MTASKRCFFSVLLMLLRTKAELDININYVIAKEKWTWFLSNQIYYMLYDDTTILHEAFYQCNSLPGARLAIFDDDVPLDDVTEYLTQYHSADQFWVDAKRKDGPDGSKHWWANNCNMSLQSELWAPNQPDSSKDFVRIVHQNGAWKYASADESQVFRPLCQSVQAPPYYLPTPPTLTWTSLGVVGHMFGFSNQTRCLDDARKACRQQAGKVYLATLDNLYDEAAEYILNNHPDRTYWLDAVNTGNTGGPSSFEWSTGGSITASLLSDQAYSSVVLVNDNSENSSMILDVSLGSHLHYYVCEGSPVLAAESPSTQTFIPTAMTWVQLGNPSREFGFSSDKQTFHDSRKICAAQTGRVRLAVLDTLFEEVREWIEVNHPDGAFWVDAVRPVTDAEFLWADGKAVDASIWKEGDPDPNDLVARIIEKNNVTVFAGTNTYDGRRYYVCERVPEVRLEWRVLGTQEKLFGFSRTHSWGLEWANETCLRQLGDVRLASLDTHFHDVIDTIETNYPDDQFWVDARRPNGDSTFHWANGTDVMSHMWHNGEPNDLYKVARIKKTTDRNQTALKSSSSSNPPYYFICEGNPATPVHRTKFSPPCELKTEVTTMTQSTEGPDASTSKQTTTDGSAFKQTTTDISTSEQLTPHITLSEMTTPQSSSFEQMTPDFSTYEQTTTDRSTHEQTSTVLDKMTLPTSTPNGCRRKCACHFNVTKINISDDDIQRNVQEIRKDLLLDKANVSATRRKLKSATDKRTSARATGWVSVGVLLVVAVVIIVPDVIVFCHAVARKLRSSKHRGART